MYKAIRRFEWSDRRVLLAGLPRPPGAGKHQARVVRGLGADGELCQVKKHDIDTPYDWFGSNTGSVHVKLHGN